MNLPDTWSPEVYERFRAQRERPVRDLLALLDPAPGGRAVDLGCGTGRYTAMLHEHVRAAETLGVDSSARMLADAAAHASETIRFEERDLRDVEGSWDVVFANASLQWVPDHDGLLSRLVRLVSPGGQFAFQVPANFGHPSHVIADEVGRDFGLEPLARTIDAHSPAHYAEVLWAAGLRDLEVVMRIYGVEMERTDDVLAWVSGSLLTSFEARLEPEAFGRFRDEYRRRLLDALGDPTGAEPYFYAFPRILARGRRPT